VAERIGLGWRGLPRFGLLADCELQKRFPRPLGQMADDVEQRVFIGGANIVDPFLRRAEGHQFSLAQIAK
jgi:hypothetical protein